MRKIINIAITTLMLIGGILTMAPAQQPAPKSEATSGNLVPNPSFEDTVSCPDWDSQIHKAPPWFQPTKGTSDYFNSCHNSSWDWVDVPINFIGYQFARTGNAYAGFSTFAPSVFPPDTSYREYIEVKLTDSLISGKKYHVSFYTSLADSANYANPVELYISKDSILKKNTNHINVTPQIRSKTPITNRVNWVKISGNYTAQGGENFITIGSFKNDTMIDTLYTKGGDTSNLNFKSAYYYVDDVTVKLDTTDNNDTISSKIKNVFIPNAFSPNNDGINDTWQIKGDIQNIHVMVYNRWGEKLFESNSINEGWEGTYQGQKVNTGVYVYYIELSTENVKNKIYKGNITLLR